MDMTEKNGQPSMEEILASIRRIIAEEPADSISLDFKPRQGTGLVPGNGAEQLAIDDGSDFELPSMFRASASPAAAEKQANTPVKLMDALRATPQLGSEFDARAQPEFPLPSSLSNGHEIPRTTAWAEQQASAHQALSSLRPAAAAAARPEPQVAQSIGHQLPVFTVPAVEAVAVELQNEQTWAPEPGKQEPGKQELGQQELGIRSSAAFDPFLNGPLQDAAEAPIVRQMAPFRDQHFARMRGGLVGEPTTVAPVETAVPEPVAPVAPIVAIVVAEPAVVETAVVGPAPAPAPALPEAASFATLAVKSNYPLPLHVLDLRAQPPAVPKIAAVDAGAVAMTSAANPTAVAMPLNPTTASDSAAPAGAIEDATAELLRPMLRQWLSDNMPRMVEKALHIEVAESVKPGKKPGTA